MFLEYIRITEQGAHEINEVKLYLSNCNNRSSSLEFVKVAYKISTCIIKV